MALCNGCGGAGCKQCIPKQAPKVFIPVEPMGAVRTTQRQKYVDARAIRYAEYKDFIGRSAMSRLKTIEPGKAVSVDVTFYMPIPESGKTSRINPLTGKRYKVDVVEGMPHIIKPDNDNLVKGLFDALNKIAWADDSQVFEIKSRKLYSEYPGIEFGIEFMD